jgi:NFU1 iron-sulfur cluster scaffold homolog, mitochondrial
MATATPNPTPNPNALKFQLDTTLDGSFNFTTPQQAQDAGHAFAMAVFAAGGVTSVFGVNDFVSVNRAEGVDWDPIVAAVQEAAGLHL